MEINYRDIRLNSAQEQIELEEKIIRTWNEAPAGTHQFYVAFKGLLILVESYEARGLKIKRVPRGSFKDEDLEIIVSRESKGCYKIIVKKNEN